MVAQTAQSQAMQQPGAVAGAGGYVYRLEPTGAVTILHDPSGKAANVTLNSGDAYEAIKAELRNEGVEPVTAPIEEEQPEGEQSADVRAPMDTGEPVNMQPQIEAESQLPAEGVRAPQDTGEPIDMTAQMQQEGVPTQPESGYDPYRWQTNSAQARMQRPAADNPAQMALALPVGDPRREQALEQALRQMLGG